MFSLFRLLLFLFGLEDAQLYELAEITSQNIDIFLDLRIANACLRRRLPVFNQLPECLSRMHQRAPSRAQDAALHTKSWSETET